MVEDIVLDTFPKEAGVYLFKTDEEVIYVGSSKNLYMRMSKHKTAIKQGSEHGYQQDLYQFLQSNTFAVEFQLTDSYRQLEQELVEKYHPKYNAVRAYTGLGARKGRVAEYNKEYNKKYKEEKKQYYESNKDEILEQAKQYYESNKQQKKQYYKSNKEEILEQQKQYYSQLCFYNGQTLTLAALSTRFKRMGIDHPTLEAKKYLIGTSNEKKYNRNTTRSSR